MSDQKKKKIKKARSQMDRGSFREAGDVPEEDCLQRKWIDLWDTYTQTS